MQTTVAAGYSTTGSLADTRQSGWAACRMATLKNTRQHLPSATTALLALLNTKARGIAVAERPIIFSGTDVRAILDGRKTQTRRIVKPQPPATHQFSGWCIATTRRKDEGGAVWRAGEDGVRLIDPHRANCPYGQPGDRLWVRETWAEHPDFPGCRYAIYRADPECEYDTDRWRPSIHMPRWASRITLEVTEVRAERLQDISEGDAMAEGAPLELAPIDYVRLGAVASRRGGFIRMWEQINGAGSWDANPWVWCVEFKKIEESRHG